MKLDFSIEKFELDLWRKQLDIFRGKYKCAKEYAELDPTKRILYAHSEFKNLLDIYKGKDRSTEKFNKRFKELVDIDEKAREDLKSFNLINALDLENKAKFEMNKIEDKINKLLYSNI